MVGVVLGVGAPFQAQMTVDRTVCRRDVRGSELGR